MIKGRLVLLLATILLLLNITGGLASDWFLDSASNQDDSTCGQTKATACQTLKVLLAKVNVGDIIHVAVGLYTGPDNINLNVNVAIQIIGDDADNCIFDLGGGDSLLTVTVPGVVIAKITVRNGIVADVNLGIINVKVAVGGVNVQILPALKFISVKFLNIRGTALLLDATGGLVNIDLNAKVGVAVILSGCTFTNITGNPALRIIGRISVRLNSVRFLNCGDDTLVVGVAIKAELGCVLIFAGVYLENNKGSTLIDLATAASLTIYGVLVINGNLVDVSLLNLNLNLDLNILSLLSITLNGNQTPIDCTNVECALINIGSLCPKACPLINLDLSDIGLF